MLYKVIVQYAMIPVTSAVIRWLKRTDATYQRRLAAARSASVGVPSSPAEGRNVG